MYKFKAIETSYAGCRFRSRLEARWAVFFDTLGIPWQYEKEGYELEGMRYLPDFWLPVQDCFIEIKGECPTEEEQHKARLLSLYSQKDVFIWYGPVELLPDDMLNTSCFLTPSFHKFKKSERIAGGPSTEQINVPSHILALYQRLFDHKLNIYIQKNGEVGIRTYTETYDVDDIDMFMAELKSQEAGLQEFKSSIEAYEEEIKEIFTLEDGWDYDFFSSSQLGFDDGCFWLECDRCGAIKAGTLLKQTHECNSKNTGNFVHNSPRLLSAYAAARSARFEFGEKGRSHNGRL